MGGDLAKKEEQEPKEDGMGPSRGGAGHPAEPGKGGACPRGAGLALGAGPAKSARGLMEGAGPSWAGPAPP